MITALIILFSALLFVLGVIVGSVTRCETGCETDKSAKGKSINAREISNFLNYDGTEQE